MGMKTKGNREHRPCGDEEDDEGLKQAVIKQNRKNKKSGGFQSMGLNPEVFRGVMKKGYKVPTPIQRKTVPLIMEGRDVVAMARTGSGKTAAFLIPLLNRLKSRGLGTKASRGARALILSPTRELALQTLKFFKDLGRFCPDTKAICVLGGDSMEKQFALMHQNPDVVIATPGRLVHLGVEMGLRFDAVEYVVFDEADRLFEMGFGEQMSDILGRLPEHRQTVLFSATLPKLLLQFARAGLTDPTLIRLDMEAKIPETLKMAFFHCRPESKPALLVHILSRVVHADQQAIVFVATRHHVEYLSLLLKLAGIDNTYIYSQLDSTARKINAAKFAAKRMRVMIVTDLAARGIDLPMLDNVVNYHFPAKSKLFVHRVGRVARAGRTGQAYSMVAGDEMAYLVDLQLFLGGSVACVNDRKDQDWHNALGTVPQSVYDEYEDQLRQFHNSSLELQNAVKVSENGYKQYLKSRPGASVESVKRSRSMKATDFGIHPLLGEASVSGEEMSRLSILDQMKNFRPSSTIFEIGNTAKSDAVRSVMTNKRAKHSPLIGRHQAKNKLEAEKEEEENEERGGEGEEQLAVSSKEDIVSTFGDKIVESRKASCSQVFVSKRGKKRKRDEENYIGYQAKDHHTEAGYSLMSGFEAQASNAVLDLTGDDESKMRKKKNLMRWDAKKKKYVKAEQDDRKKIKTESGVWIPASYKSDRYSKWKERSKLAQMQEEDGDDDEEDSSGRKRQFQGLPKNHPAMKKAASKRSKNEILKPEQIMKNRKTQAKSKTKNQRKSKKGKKKK